MYGNGLASNTKYTDFIKFYDYDDHDRHHLLERQVNTTTSEPRNSVVTPSQDVRRREIVTSVQVHRKASSVIEEHANEDGMGMLTTAETNLEIDSAVLAAKTKFADIFTAEESNALRQLLKDRERVDGVTKTLSDTDLLKLHDAVKRNFELSARIFDVKRRAQSERERAEEEELREIETDVRRVNQETLRALAAVNVPEGEEFGDVRKSTSYRTMLQAEHVALRRELLNNLRQLSKGTYGEVVAEEGAEERVEQVEGPLKTADPAERVGEWLQKSQEHLSGAGGASGGAEGEEGQTKGTSLFHDAMWKEEPEFDNEEPQVEKTEWSDGILEVRIPDVVESPDVLEDEVLQVKGQELEGPLEASGAFSEGSPEGDIQEEEGPIGTETKFTKQYSKDAADDMLPLGADAASLSPSVDSPEIEIGESPGDQSSPEAELMALEEETSPLPEDIEEDIIQEPQAVLRPDMPDPPDPQVTQRSQTATIRQPPERPPTPYPQDKPEGDEAQTSHRSIAVSIPEEASTITETKFSRIHRRSLPEALPEPLPLEDPTQPPHPPQHMNHQTEIIVLPSSTRTEPPDPEPALPPEGVLAAVTAAQLAPPTATSTSSEHRRFSKFQRRKKHASSTTDLSHYANRGTSLDPNYRSYSYTNVNRIRVYPTVAIIPQPTHEKFPDRIFKPRENYQQHSSVTPRTLSRLSNNNYHSDYSLYESSDNSNTVLIKSKPFSSNNELATVQAAGDVIITGGGYTKNKSQHNSRSKMPGVLRRHNPEQWVAKKVYFFVNGDEHYPKFEYRFRPFKDVKNLDTLYDILSKRLNLSHGVRHIFTIDGEPVRHLGEFKNEHFYVASSTKKFKIVHYGRGEPITQRTHDLEEEFREFVDQHEDRSPERRRSRSRSMGRSAPSNKKPPVIRIRRDQSLNGNVWGSPQQPASTTSDSTVSPMMDPPSSSIQHDDIILPSAAAQAQQQQQQQTQTPRKARKRSMKRKPPTTGSSELINVTNPPSSLVRSLSRSDLLSRDEGQARSHLQLASDVRRSKSHEQLMERERRGSHESLATTTTTSTSNANAGRGHHNHHVTHHHHHHHQLPDYAEEAKKFVRTAMIEASNKPVDKQIIRIINGYSPSIQSQVLLNTKTTQPWEELVRDLGMAVKLPKSRATTMETISGRKIQSYSQLRTELLAGNLAFYIYPERDMSNEFGLPPLSRNVNARMPERSLGKAEAKGTKGNKNDKKLPPLVNQSQSGSNGSSKNLNNMDRYQVGGHHKSYEALHDTETKYRRSKHQQQHERQNRYGSVTQLDVNDNGGLDGGHRANSRSNPALRSRSPYPEQTSTGVQTTLDVPQKKRETRRRRSEASVYLASASRSRSRSISPN